MSPEAVAALVAQVLAIYPNGMSPQQAIQISEAITSAIPAVAATPQDQMEDDRKWSHRVSNAHEKLRYWNAQFEKRREAQRRLSRQVEDAVAHLKYWQANLEAAKRKDPKWESRDPYVEIDFDRDSCAGDQVEHDQDLMDAEAPCALDSQGPGSTAMEMVKATDGIMFSNMVRPHVCTTFPQHPPTPSAVGAGAGKPTAPQLLTTHDQALHHEALMRMIHGKGHWSTDLQQELEAIATQIQAERLAVGATTVEVAPGVSPEDF